VRKEDSNKLTKHLKLCRFFNVVIWRAPRNAPKLFPLPGRRAILAQARQGPNHLVPSSKEPLPENISAAGRSQWTSANDAVSFWPIARK
jgi:hypothetical protein